MIPEFPFLTLVGELYAITLCKIPAITRMKVFLICTGFNYCWGVCVEGEAAKEKPLIEGRVNCPSPPWRRSLMKEYLNLPV
jgi:hypothetical protein